MKSHIKDLGTRDIKVGFDAKSPQRILDIRVPPGKSDIAISELTETSDLRGVTLLVTEFDPNLLK